VRRMPAVRFSIMAASWMYGFSRHMSCVPVGEQRKPMMSSNQNVTSRPPCCPSVWPSRLLISASLSPRVW
jgi:hypothetical protein